MNTWVEITKSAFYTLVGDEDLTWRDYKAAELVERSYYYSHGVRLQASHTFIGDITQYYVEDINA